MINPTLRTSDRCSYIGGSDARTILGKDEKALLRLWQEKRGEIEPEDLSGNLLVQFGGATEELNRRWFERETGHSIGAVQRLLPAGHSLAESTWARTRGYVAFRAALC